jgi:starvation-inducible outer membrane lipoprotein
MMRAALFIAAMALALTACSERPQASHGMQRHDAAAYTGASKAFADAGWKAGDKASWEAHLKVRAQRGQNDYYGVKK